MSMAIMAGRRVTYIHSHMTMDQATSTTSGVRIGMEINISVFLLCQVYSIPLARA